MYTCTIEICIIVCVPDIKMNMFKPNVQLTATSGFAIYIYRYIPLKALNVFVKCSFYHKYWPRYIMHLLELSQAITQVRYNFSDVLILCLNKSCLTICLVCFVCVYYCLT